MKTLFSAISAASLGLALAVSGGSQAQSVSDEWAGYLDDLGDSFEGERTSVHFSSNLALHLGMFSAANAVAGTYENPLMFEVEVGEADADYAAISAAAELMTRLYGSVNDDVMASASGYRDGLSETAIADSEALATAIVDALFERLQQDYVEAEPYRPFAAPGVYVPTAAPVGRRATVGTPFLLNSRDELFPEGPPALDSDAWADDYNEVKELGSDDSETRTEEQTFEANFWVSKDWEPLLEQVVEARDLSILEASRLYAMLTIATGDAGLTTFAAKHHFHFWRPETAIRNGDLDERDDTELEAGWTPLLRSPMHPEYPCAHCSYGAAVSTVLDTEVPLQDGETVQVFAYDEPEEIVEIDNFNAFSERMSMSRLYGGVHYRTSNEHAEWIGQETAARVLEAFRPSD